MPSIKYIWLMALLAASAASCTKEPAPHYRFSTEQLAWQPYQQGQVLRFSNSRTNTVRTYAVGMVANEENQLYTGPNLTPFPSRNQPYYQEVEAYAGRTDSVGNGAASVAALRFDRDGTFPSQVKGEPGPAIARVSWPNFYTAALPVDELNSGSQLDSLNFQSLKLIPSLTLGLTTYAQVVRIRIPMQRAGDPIGTLYYAKSLGVVAYNEAGTGLWYRLP